MRLITAVLTTFIVVSSGLSLANQTTVSPKQQALLNWATLIWESMDRQQGKVKLPNNVATLNLTDKYYYLSPKDSHSVLTTFWGNPPGPANLGMLLPLTKKPIDKDAWGIVIQYHEEGYIANTNVDGINFSKMMQQIQNTTRKNNTNRIDTGYESVKVIGWDTIPSYHPSTHILHWGKELKFGNQAIHTLNYDIRILGRKGVLALNIIGSIAQKTEIEAQLPNLAALVEFSPGYQYKDFKPKIDQTAQHNIATLISGKTQPPFIIPATLSMILEKFWIVALIALTLLSIKTLLNREKKPVIKQSWKDITQ